MSHLLSGIIYICFSLYLLTINVGAFNSGGRSSDRSDLDGFSSSVSKKGNDISYKNGSETTCRENNPKNKVISYQMLLIASDFSTTSSKDKKNVLRLVEKGGGKYTVKMGQHISTKKCGKFKFIFKQTGGNVFVTPVNDISLEYNDNDNGNEFIQEKVE